jgi:hypothetical protein
MQRVVPCAFQLTAVNSLISIAKKKTSRHEAPPITLGIGGLVLDQSGSAVVHHSNSHAGKNRGFSALLALIKYHHLEQGERS